MLFNIILALKFLGENISKLYIFTMLSMFEGALIAEIFNKKTTNNLDYY